MGPFALSSLERNTWCERLSTGGKSYVVVRAPCDHHFQATAIGCNGIITGLNPEMLWIVDVSRVLHPQILQPRAPGSRHRSMAEQILDGCRQVAA
jgi:hypothetical protein